MQVEGFWARQSRLKHPLISYQGNCNYSLLANSALLPKAYENGGSRSFARSFVALAFTFLLFTPRALVVKFVSS